MQELDGLEVPLRPALFPLGVVGLDDEEELDLGARHDVGQVDGAGAAEAEEGQAHGRHRLGVPVPEAVDVPEGIL